MAIFTVAIVGFIRKYQPSKFPHRPALIKRLLAPQPSPPDDASWPPHLIGRSSSVNTHGARAIAGGLSVAARGVGGVRSLVVIAAATLPLLLLLPRLVHAVERSRLTSRRMIA